MGAYAPAEQARNLMEVAAARLLEAMLRTGGESLDGAMLAIGADDSVPGE